MKRGQYKLRKAHVGLTCSFWMLATAFGLLGWTPGDVTEGQPFCGMVFELRQLSRNTMITSVKYIFLFWPCCIHQSRSAFTTGHDLLATPLKKKEKFEQEYSRAIPVDADCEKNGNMWASITSIALSTSWASLSYQRENFESNDYITFKNTVPSGMKTPYRLWWREYECLINWPWPRWPVQQV